MKKKWDPRLYLVTDRELADEKSLEDVVKKAVVGGVTVVQLREKDCSTREFLDLALKIKQILKQQQIPLIINDRIDIALAAGAEGVHVGQNDMPYPKARELMGPHAIIGLTVETMEQAQAAEKLDADYWGVSTIFATPTKTDTVNEWGIEGLTRLRKQTAHRIVAIGGLNAKNITGVIKAGADGVAVVSAICAARDPEAAARELRALADQALTGK